MPKASTLLVILSFFLSFCAFAQQDSTSFFTLSGQFRPRVEFRDGYRTLPQDTLNPATFISSRTRLNFDYTTPKTKFHVSLQDVRVWGATNTTLAIGSLGILEAYAGFKLGKRWYLKMGRQAVELDNGRLIARANWNQFSRVHEGFRFDYDHKKIKSNFLFFYNQTGFNNFNTYYPSSHYKYLAIQNTIVQLNPKLKLTVANYVDGYQGFSNSVVHVRATSGGRITYQQEKKLKLTFAGYYQYGQLATGQNISAYYLQPEVSLGVKKWQFKGGAEYFSGSDNAVISSVSRAFDGLYGVRFRLNGHLNYFFDFNQDMNGAGLFNPYLFIQYDYSEKLKFKLENHLFYAANSLLNTNGETVNPFLGIESDLKVKYIFTSRLFLDFGVSIMDPTNSMEVLKIGNSAHTPVFAFTMLTWKPTFLKVPAKPVF